jgi:hypothetical protein
VASPLKPLISPLEGEMSGRTEGGDLAQGQRDLQRSIVSLHTRQ